MNAANNDFEVFTVEQLEVLPGGKKTVVKKNIKVDKQNVDYFKKIQQRKKLEFFGEKKVENVMGFQEEPKKAELKFTKKFGDSGDAHSMAKKAMATTTTNNPLDQRIRDIQLKMASYQKALDENKEIAKTVIKTVKKETEEEKQGGRDDRRLPTHPIRVTNLNEDVTELDLKDFFGKYGDIFRVYMPPMRDRAGEIIPGRHRGFAYVHFKRKENAAKAVELANGESINYSVIEVSIAQPKK